MPWYNVIIGLESRPTKDALAKNLTESHLVNEIVESMKRHEKFKCGADIINPDDISSIKITESEHFFHPLTFFDSEEGRFAYNWQAINRMKDVTNKFIKTFPKRKKEMIKETRLISKNVFIVHGRNHKSMKELKTMLKDFGLNPIVLHEQPSGSRTVVEKLEKYSDVGYAIVILTPDDRGCLNYEFTQFEADIITLYFRRYTPKIKTEELNKRLYSKFDDFHKILKQRARQNVVLEFGYFIGLLGRDRVCCLLKGDVERPSDMHGIVYIPFKESVNEVKDKIVKELKAAGYQIKT